MVPDLGGQPLVMEVVAPDTLFGVRKEKPNGGSIIIRRSLIISVHVNKQAVLLAAAVRTAEVAGLTGPGVGAGRARPHEEAARREQG